MRFGINLYTLGVETFKKVDSRAEHAESVQYAHWYDKPDLVTAMVDDHFSRCAPGKKTPFAKSVDCRGFEKDEYLRNGHCGLHADHIRAKFNHSDFDGWMEHYAKTMRECIRLVEAEVGRLGPEEGAKLKRRRKHASIYMFCKSGRDRSVALARAMNYLWTTLQPTEHFYFDCQSSTVEHLCQAHWRHEQRPCVRAGCSACFGDLAPTMKDLIRRRCKVS